jgi:hypothetical protein
MNGGCPKCDENRETGDRFCGACGSKLMDTGPKNEFGSLVVILLAATAFIIFIAAFEAITLIVNTLDILDLLSDKNLGFFVLIPAPTVIFSLGSTALQLYWVLVVIIILSCIANAVRGFIDTVRSPEGRTEQSKIEKTPAFWLCVLLSASLLLSFVIRMIVTLTGSETTSPDFGDVTTTMFFVAEAAFWEEIITRMLFIGVPMIIISFIITKKKESLKCLLGGFGMSTAAVALIIMSGAIFGLAHYSGWDNQVWKVIDAGIMGMFLGYLFVRFGLWASILMHFVNNFISSFNWMGAEVLSLIVVLSLLGIGFISLIYITIRLFQSREAIASLPAFRNECNNGR